MVNALVNTGEESDLSKIFIPIAGMIGTGITIKKRIYGYTFQKILF